MLDTDLKTQLKAYLERLKGPLELVAATDDGDASRDLRALLADISDQSERVTVVEEDTAGERIPSFQIRRPGESARVRFAGLPLGHEFTSLVLGLLHVGGHPPKVDPETLERIRALDGEFRFETYVSLSCQNCPDVVQALNLMSAINPRISNVTIDGALFRDEVEGKGVLAVPSVYLNGEPFGQGRMGLEEILAKLDTGADARTAERLSERAPYDMLIVGAGPAGAAAAVYAARKGIRVGIVAERFGGQVQDTLGIENYPSVLATEGPLFATALEQQVHHYGVDVITGQRAVALEPAAVAGLVTIRLESGAVLKGRSIILSTGARWRNVGVPGEAEYRNRGVAYCPHCDGPLFKGKPVAVIGGGNSGVEAAIDLAGIASKVTLIEFTDSLRADAVLVSKLESLPNVSVHTQAQTTEIRGAGNRVVGLDWKHRATGEMNAVTLDGVFVQIGLVPNTEWLKGTVDLSRFGEIEIDAGGRTNLPGVFAAGDATTVPYKQIVIAAGDGAKAALSAFDYLIRTPTPAAEPSRSEETETAAA
jgi:alkyl hydroperoxide reductase subunit F